jgi:hypothetical protein
MTRRRVAREPLPKAGRREPVAWLPRDIALGCHDAPKGTLLEGWDAASDSRQLWQVLGPLEKGGESMAELIGFVCSTWNGNFEQ